MGNPELELAKQEFIKSWLATKRIRHEREIYVLQVDIKILQQTWILWNRVSVCPLSLN